MDTALGLLGEVLKCVGSRTIDQFSYLVHYKRNVNDLSKQMEILEQLEKDVQHSVDAAHIKREVIKEVVKGWLTRVNLLQSKETKLQNDLKDSKGCFSCSIHYQVGKDAKQMIDEVKELLNEGRTINVMSNPSPLPPSLEIMETLDFQVYGSTRIARDQIMEALKREDVNMVGVYGLGGVGKTTLMKEVAKFLKRENLFNQVVMVTVSQDPVWTKIQGEIAENFGLKLTEESPSVRARRLLDRLKMEQCILIVLDDVWKPLNLPEEVGIPYGNNCKVVLTTRQLEVCRQMKTQVNVEVKVLSEGDAWLLFKGAVGAQIEDDHTLRPVAEQIVGECGGLPLAIVTIGRALLDKDQYEWRDAANQLKNSSSVPPDIEGMHEKVFSSIKLSYDFLGNDATKSCLLLCCMFPEDFSIGEEYDLLPYVVGEGVFVDVDTLAEVRNRLHTQMERLKRSCLLFDDGHNRVKMHDIIRDVSIWIASKEGNDFVIKSGRGLTHFPHLDNLRKCKRLSLMQNKITKLPNRLMDCSQLITLSLIGNFDLTKIPDEFFQGMVSLKTLDLRGTCLSSLPSSLSCCTDLRVLLLISGNNGLPALNVSLLGKLKKLEILEIFHYDEIELPEEIGELVNLKSLNLLGNENLLTIAPNTLSRLSLLEELNVGSISSIMPWEWEEEEDWEEEEVIGKASPLREVAPLLEVASLSALTRLDIRGLNAKYLCANIACRWENLTHFNVSFGPYVQSYDDETGPPTFTKALIISKSSNHAIADWVRMYLLEHAELLQFIKCGGLKNVLGFGATITGLNNLRFLYVAACDDMEYLLSAVEDEVPPIAFTSLEWLDLVQLPKFKAICSHGSSSSLLPMPPPIFGNLRRLRIGHCKSLKHILPMSLAQGLPRLEELIIMRCSNLEEIIVNDDTHKKEAIMSKLVFPGLRVLRLLDLESLSMVSRDDWPSLENLVIEDCPNLRRFPLNLKTATKLKTIWVAKGWFDGLEWDDDQIDDKLHLQERVQVLFFSSDEDEDPEE